MSVYRNPMEPDTDAILQAFSEHLLNHQQSPLTASQRTVLEWCLSRPRSKYKDMAEATGYTANSLRDAGARLFAVVASVVGRRVKKANCGQIMQEWYEREVAPAASQLFGRETDLQVLLEAFHIEGRRLICISGPPRMGKTYLAGRLCQQLRTLETFESQVWCHANTLPTIESLYHSVLNYLGEPHPANGLPAAAQLTHLLETRKLLLVLEKPEMLYQSEALGERFKAESSGYEQWLRTLLDRHSLRSCVVLVCRVPPQCLQRSHDMLHHYLLRGMDANAAERLLRQQGLQDYPAQQLHALAQFCGYNPGVLMAAADKVRDSGDRNIIEVMRYPLAVPHADDSLWQETLDRLTPSEQTLIGWLLLYPDITLKKVNDGIELNGRHSRTCLAVMQSLRNHGWVDTDAAGAYYLSTEWLQHVAQHHLLARLATAFENQDVQVFGQHPLVVPNAPLWRRQRHWRYVLEPLGDQLEQLNRQAWTTQYRSTQINAMINDIRARPELQTGYATGNLLNVAVALNVPLAELDLAGLTISHADLWTTRLQQANLTGCQLVNTVLPVALHGPLTAALSPDGTTIAVGDAAGRLLCWHRVDAAYKLYRFTQITATSGHPQPIARLAFGDEEMLAIVAGSEIYRWWIGDGQTSPNWLMAVSSPVTSLTCCCDEYVAVGLNDGRVVVWYDSVERQVERHRHLGAVQDLVANPDPYSDQLASRGHGDRILVWNVRDVEADPWEIRPERYFFFGLAWQHGNPLSAAYVGEQFLLRLSDGTTELLPFQGDITMLKFSQNGGYLAALKRQTVEIRSLDHLTQGISIAHNGLLNTLAISNDGSWLLTAGQNRTNSPHTIQVWDIEAQQLCWEITAQPVRSSETMPELGLDFRECQGLTDVERAYWQNYGAVL